LGELQPLNIRLPERFQRLVPTELAQAIEEKASYMDLGQLATV